MNKKTDKKKTNPSPHLAPRGTVVAERKVDVTCDSCDFTLIGVKVLIANPDQAQRGGQSLTKHFIDNDPSKGECSHTYGHWDYSP